MLIKTLMLGVFCVTFSAPLLVQAAPECPESIPASSVKISSPAEGWVPYVAAPLYLHAAAPMSGPPDMKGDLADFKETRGKGEWSYTYSLDGTFADGKWLQCTYGEYNQLTLSRRLPDETRECKLTYRKGAKAGQHQIKITCN
jgi:hypothetical protein